MVAAVSFVIPAYRSGATLGRTLRSIQRQTDADWHAIVVDDGSDDRTSWVARNWCARDSRFELIEVDHGGAGRARNRGIDAGDSEWIVFVDADDTVSRHFLRHMRAVAARRSTRSDAIDVVACGYDRVDEAGRVSARVAPLPLDRDPVRVCVSGPPGAIHSFLVRRRCVEGARRFDETLITNEDWDLWLRIAADGARFAVTGRRLATYWSTPNSLSRGGVRMLEDSRTVMLRARSVKVTPGRGLQLFDQSRRSIDDNILRNAFWSAGVAIGQGDAALDLIGQIPPTAAVGAQKTHLIEKLMDGLVVGSSLPLSRLIVRWEAMRPPVDDFIDAVITHTKHDRDATALKEQVQTLVARYGRFPGAVPLGTVMALSLDVRVLASGYRPPPGIDLVVLRIRWLRPAAFFSYVVPVFGRITTADFARAIHREVFRRLAVWLKGSEARLAVSDRLWRAAALARRALRLTRADPPHFPLQSATRARRARREREIGAELAASMLPRAPDRRADAVDHPGTGADAAHWNAFFASEDPWDYGSAYEQLKYRRTLDLLPCTPQTRALELACAEGRFTAMLAPAVASLHAVDISQAAIERAQARTAAFGNVTFAQGDLFRDPIVGPYDLITCSEVLYFAPSLQGLDALAGRIADALTPGGHFAHAHAYELIDDPTRTAFDWDDTVGAGGVFRAFAAEPRLAHVRTTETDLYRIDLFRRVEPAGERPAAVVEHVGIGAPVDARVAGHVVWNGALRTRASLVDARTCTVPVFRLDTVPLDQLERHLRFLRRRGFASIAPDALIAAGRWAGILAGRPVMLTAGYRDPAWVAEALPIICRNGFELHAFVGAHAALDWEALIAQVGEGMTVGSALSSDRPADDLPCEVLHDEGLQSRLLLEHVLRVPVRTVSPPYGQSDTRVEQVLAAAGYHRLFVRDAGLAHVAGMEMMMPTLTIGAGMTAETFHAMLPPGTEPPDAGDVA